MHILAHKRCIELWLEDLDVSSIQIFIRSIQLVEEMTIPRKIDNTWLEIRTNCLIIISLRYKETLFSSNLK